MGAPTYRRRRFGAAEVGPLSCILAVLAFACTPAGPRPGAAPTPGSDDELLILVTAGMQGRILPFDEDGSPTAAALAALTPVIDSLRATHRGPVVLVDAGHSLAGSRVAEAYAAGAPHDHAMLRALRIARYDAAAIPPEDPAAALDLTGVTAPAIVTVRAGQPRAAVVARRLPDGRTLHVHIVPAPRGDSSAATTMPTVGEAGAPDSDTVRVVLVMEPEAAVATGSGRELALSPGVVAPGAVRAIRVPLAPGRRGVAAVAAVVPGDPARADRALADSVRWSHERALLRASIAPAGVAATRVRIVATADLEGRVLPQATESGFEGGAAALIGAVRWERELFQGPTLLLDAGGAFALDSTADADVVAGLMTLAGYDATAVGAGEAAAHGARGNAFPRLAANLRVADGDTAPAWVRPAALLDAGGGVRVGVVGLTSEALDATGLRALDGAAALDRWVPELRAQGADFVVALAHAGGDCAGETRCRETIDGWIRAARARPDVVVAGRPGTPGISTVEGVPVVAPHAHGRGYAVIDMELRDGVADVRVRGIPRVADAGAAPDRRSAELVARHLRGAGRGGAAAVLAEPFTRGPGEHALGRFVTDAYRWATGAQVALEAADAFATDLAPGALTADAAAAALPRDEPLVVLQLTASQLRRALESVIEHGAAAQLSGLDAWYDAALPAGARLLTIRLEDGRFVGDEGLIAIVVRERLTTDPRLPVLGQAVHRRATGVRSREAVLDYARGLPQPVAAPRNERLRAAPREGGGG